MKEGTLLRWKQGLITVGLFLLFITIFNQQVVLFKDAGKIGFFDYLMELFKGIEVYRPDSQTQFSVPGIWMFLLLYLFFKVNSYPFSDAHSYGQQVLMRSTSRTKWWLSKCLWLISEVFVFYLIGYLILGFATIFSGTSFFSLNHYINENITQITSANTNILKLISTVLFLPIVVSISIALMQLTISFAMNSPVIGYIFSVVLLVASAYKCNSFLIGNYLMLKRNSLFISDGVSTASGYCICVVFSILAIIIGCIRIQYYDVLAYHKK